MNISLAQLWATFRREPAAFLYMLAAVVTPLAASVLHWNHQQVAATATIASGLAAIIVAYHTRPVSAPVVLGAATTIATASAAYGLKISPAEIATLAAVVNGLLGWFVRANQTPVVTLKPAQAKITAR